jgi:D-alanyl-D-alanine carboxypeptidase
MKKVRNKTSKQSGFFDLGLSLVVMAVAGSSAYAIETTQPENAQVAESAQPAMVIDLNTGRNYPQDDVQ